MKRLLPLFIPVSLTALLLPLATAPQHGSPRYAVHTTPQAISSARRFWVRVELLDPDLAPSLFTAASLQRDVERQLRQAGITVVTPAQAAKMKFDVPLLEIGIDTNNDVEDWYGYNVAARLREGVLLARNPRQGVIGAITWEQRDVGMLAQDELGQIKGIVGMVVEDFLRDYAATHPGIRVPREKVLKKTPDA